MPLSKDSNSATLSFPIQRVEGRGGWRQEGGPHQSTATVGLTDGPTQRTYDLDRHQGNRESGGKWKQGNGGKSMPFSYLYLSSVTAAREDLGRITTTNPQKVGWDERREQSGPGTNIPRENNLNVFPLQFLKRIKKATQNWALSSNCLSVLMSCLPSLCKN